MKYYNAKDVMEITGCGQNKSYQIIRELNKSFKKKYPNSIPIQGLIPIWYFEESQGINPPKKEEREEF